MKKIAVILVALLGLKVHVSAQPVIQRNWVKSPFLYQLIADNYGYNTFGAIAPGPAGNGVTWNIQLSPNDFQGRGPLFNVYQNPTGKPGATSFPGTNLAVQAYETLDTVQWQYFKITNDSLAMIGIWDENEQIATINYTNPEKTMVFPFAFQQKFQDQFGGKQLEEGILSGNSEFTYDGFGTLNLNGKTYKNVIRLKKTGVKTSVFVLDDFEITTVTTEESYSFFINFYEGILTILNYDIKYTGRESGEIVLEQTVKGSSVNVFEAPTVSNKISPVSFKTTLLGNPVSDHLLLSLTAPDALKGRAFVMDLNGRIFLSQSLDMVQGEQQIQIPVDQLIPGHYRLVLNDDHGGISALPFIKTY